jgi:hypothetical protein
VNAPRAVALGVLLALVSTGAPAAAGVITLSPDPLEFGDVVVGTTRDLTLTIASAGSDSTVTSFVGVGDCSRYTFPGTTFPLPVPEGEAREVTVRFRPQARGDVPCQLSTLVGAGDVPDDVEVTGRGTAAAMTTSLEGDGDFGDVTVGQSASLTLTIRNGAGVDPLTVTVDVPTGGDQFTVGAGPVAPIPGGDETTLVVSYTPTTRGGHAGQIRIRTASGGANVEDTYTLEGTGLQSELQLTDPTFPDAIVGGATPFSTAQVNVRNLGNVAFAVDRMTLSAGDLTFDDSALGCTSGTACETNFTVAAAPNSGRNVRIRCTPTALGIRSATLTVTSGAGIGTNTVVLSCHGVTPAVSVSPPTVAFGPVRIGTDPPPTETVRVRNAAGVDSAPLVYSFAVSGSAFSVQSTMCTSQPCTLAPGESDDFVITFTPEARGPVNGAFTITSNDPDTPTLTGTGLRSLLTLDAPADGSLELGNVTMPGTSAPGTITISNDGNEDLHITGVTRGGANADQIAITSGQTGAQAVPPGQERSWTVTCTPTVPGDRNATISIANDSPTPRRQVTVTCTGRGALLTTSAQVAFGQVAVDTVAARTITVTNEGNEPTRITTLTIVGDRFSAEPATGSLPLDVAASAAVQVRVTFAPLDGDPRTGSLVIENGGVTQPTVALTGDGTTGVDIDPAPVAFGDVRVGSPVTRHVTVTNGGQATLQVYQAAIENPAVFTIVGFTARSLAPGEAMTFNVRAQLTAMGAVMGTLRVRARVQPGTDEVAGATSVTATGVAPEIRITTDDAMPADTTLDFGGVDIDLDAVTRTVTIGNAGTGAFALTSCEVTGDAPFRLASAEACDRTVMPGETVNIAILFEPAHEQAFATGNRLTIGTDVEPVAVELTGIGVDRHIGVSPLAIEFPTTFRNPRTAPTVSVDVTNVITRDDGLPVGAPLRLSMVTTGPPFSVDVSATPIIEAGTSLAIPVRFAPGSAGTFTGSLVITSDDSDTMVAEIALTGTAIDRDVAVAPMVVDVGRTYEDVAVRLSDRVPGAIAVTNHNASAQFEITRVEVVSGSSAFVPVLPAVRTFGPGATVAVDIEFVPRTAGPHDAIIVVFLDGEPVPHAQIEVRGHADEARGTYYGCSASAAQPSRPLALLLAAWLSARSLSRRRRR